MAAVLPPPGGSGLPTRDERSDAFDRGRSMLGVDPANDAIDVVQLDDETMELNMGPQHPSTHGVLRLVLELDGEVVRECRPDIGFLHTGFEKSFESHTWQQCIPFTDRMDYLAPLFNNLGFSLAAERLLGVEVPERAQYLRVIMCELTRVASHFLWYGTSALDLGATTPFVYAWREREKLLDINELVSGVRMHTSFIRVGGLLADVPDEFYALVNEVVRTFPAFIDQYELLITQNPIWMERTRGLGVLTPRRRHRVRRHRADAARQRHPVRPAQGAAVQLVRPLRLRHPDRNPRGRVRPLPRAHARGARVAEDHRPGHGPPPRRPGQHQ